MISRVLLTAAVGAAAAAPAAGAASKPIAAVSKGSVRAVVVARKTSGGLAPSASVSVVGYRRSAGAWHRTGTHRLPGTFFWKTVTASHSLCRLKLTGTTLTISVLVTPSLGCDRPRTVSLS